KAGPAGSRIAGALQRVIGDFVDEDIVVGVVEIAHFIVHGGDPLPERAVSNIATLSQLDAI
ncbi:MAG TPA: hypothetical protein VK834_15430, partial [Bradyrhizobium sp.]|nr:hypothetical protein [Bradyrhizobium sp.]